MSSSACEAQPPHHRRWKVIGLVLAGGLIGYATFRGLEDSSDLVGFHETAVHLWRTGELTPQLGWKFYLPGTAVLIFPLIVWPMWITAPLWASLNVITLWWTVRQCARLAVGLTAGPEPAEPAHEFHIRWTWPLFAVFAYAADSISLGQFNIFVLALCVAAYSQSRCRNREYWAGALAGLAAVIKLYPLMLIVFWCARGQWKAGASAALAFVLIAGGASLAVFGWKGTLQTHRVWLEHVRGSQYVSQAADGSEGSDIEHLMFTRRAHQWMRHNNQSLPAVVRRLLTKLPPDSGYRERPVNVANLAPRTAYRLYIAVAATVLAMLVTVTWYSRKDAEIPGVFAAWMACVVAFVPVYWTHYFVLALPAIALLSRCRRGNRWAQVLLLAWIAGEVLLASRSLRLVGLHCWLMLAVALWVGRYRRHGTKDQACEHGRTLECASDPFLGRSNALP